MCQAAALPKWHFKAIQYSSVLQPVGRDPKGVSKPLFFWGWGVVATFQSVGKSGLGPNPIVALPHQI